MINKKLKYYIESARLRTLPLSISGIIMGSLLAYSNDKFNFWILLSSILTAMSLQILSNYANELGDTDKGTDNDERIGPKRSIQKGLLTRKNIVGMIISFIGASVGFGLLLVWLSFHTLCSPSAIFVILLGLSAIWASMKYTLGKDAYGYMGLGDLFVFLFFGWVSVCGTYFLMTQSFIWTILLPASSIGLLSVAMLNINNMRDVENDSKHSKKTVVVRIGIQKAKTYHSLIIIIGLGLMLLYNLILKNTISHYLFVVSFPIFYFHLKSVKSSTSQELDKQMKIVSLAIFIFTITFGLGIWIA